MKPKSLMLIAGEASGDLLAAELIRELREELTALPPIPTTDYQPLQTTFQPRFFGAGGPRMASAGVELDLDLTRHAVIGISDVVKNYLKFRRLFQRLYRLAVEREPDAIICVDFSGFNRRFAHAIKRYTESRQGWFQDWNPKLIQYVSPQVWASREGRAYQMARDYDLLLSIFPFEPGWYAKRVPALPVEFVGNPIVDRYAALRPTSASPQSEEKGPLVLLLPGSRTSELSRHLPVLLSTLTRLRAQIPSLRARMVLPTDALVKMAKAGGLPDSLEVRMGGLPESLQESTVALASTGTVTMECAFFGVPTVAFYKTSWSTYQIARRIVTVKYLAMPNLLANESVFPEFIQDAATAKNIANAAWQLLTDDSRRKEVKLKLSAVIASLGSPGASQRAAKAIARLLKAPMQDPRGLALSR